MRSTNMLTILVLAFVLAFGTISISRASVPMGTAFTYQGRLIDSNDAADGLYDFQFRLFDDPCTGGQQGGTIDINDLDVIDGYFTVELDFGNSVFDGDSRWLDIGVRPFDSNEPNAFVSLIPRQEITPSPYALYAKTAGDDGDWRISVNDMYAIPLGNVGIGTTSPEAKLSIQMPEGFIMRPSTVGGLVIKKALYNIANQLEVQDALGNTSFVVHDTGNVGIGTTIPDEKLTVEGTIKSSNAELSGSAVYGHASGTGTNMGGYFRADGDTGRGVMGQGVGVSAFGVYGMADGIFGIGVFGQASGSSGTNRGVYGKTNSPDGYAGYFEGGRNYFEGDVGIGITNPSTKLDVVGTVNATAFVGDGSGLTGIAADSDWEVLGNNMSAIPAGNVSIGVTPSPSARLLVAADSVSTAGKFGNTSTTGHSYAVYGQATGGGGSNHYGVYGFASNATTNYGIYGNALGGTTNWSGYFVGDVFLGGKVGIGTTSPSAKLDVDMGTVSGVGGAATIGGSPNAATGDFAIATGYSTTAGGGSSTAMGMWSTASGYASTAIGYNTDANGSYSTAMGYDTKATELATTAMGIETIASGRYSTAMGYGIEARGQFSIAIALNNQGGAIVYEDNTMAIMGGNVGIGTKSPNGKLDVNGSIYQRGTELHADYVFELDYELESIDEHSEFMWKEKHLPAIPKARTDDNGQEIVEVGSHRKGIVEELEKAHIYIEQLHERIKTLEEKLVTMEVVPGAVK